MWNHDLGKSPDILHCVDGQPMPLPQFLVETRGLTLWGAMAAICTLCTGANLLGGEPARGAATDPRHSSASTTSIEIVGKIIPGSGSQKQIDFKADSNNVFHVIRNDRSEALFADTNLFSRTLILKGVVDPGSKKFEITTKLHSLRNGRRYELYYYCDVCSIVSSDPGPCMCCRDPVLLVEKPE